MIRSEHNDARHVVECWNGINSVGESKMCRYAINKLTNYITGAMMWQSQAILIFVT
jgi:hypothetical protein